MTFYVVVKTNSEDIRIDFFEFVTKEGELITADWDESDIARDETGFSARYKGVSFNSEYANGKLDKLKEAKFTDIQVYYEDSEPKVIELLAVCVHDGDDHYDIPKSAFSDLRIIDEAA